MLTALAQNRLMMTIIIVNDTLSLCQVIYSIFTSGAYRATVPTRLFLKNRGGRTGVPGKLLAGVEKKLHFAALPCSE
jgi:hypothetical protein